MSYSAGPPEIIFSFNFILQTIGHFFFFSVVFFRVYWFVVADGTSPLSVQHLKIDKDFDFDFRKGTIKKMVDIHNQAPDTVFNLRIELRQVKNISRALKLRLESIIL